MATSHLSDRQWDRLRSLPPPQKSRTGRPAKDHRPIRNGILWIVRTGSPWRCLPERYGSWKTVSSRFSHWQKAGVGNRLLADLQRQADAEGRLDWRLPFVDSTVARAHQHAAGAQRGVQTPKCSGAAGAATARRSICGANAVASRWCWC